VNSAYFEHALIFLEERAHNFDLQDSDFSEVTNLSPDDLVYSVDVRSIAPISLFSFSKSLEFLASRSPVTVPYVPHYLVSTPHALEALNLFHSLFSASLLYLLHPPNHLGKYHKLEKPTKTHQNQGLINVLYLVE